MSLSQSPSVHRRLAATPVSFENEATLLIGKISRLAAEETSPEAFVQAATREIGTAPTTTEVSLTLRNPVTGEVWQSTDQQDRTAKSEFSLDLEVRGLRYGRLELRTTGGAATALMMAQTLADQLARFGELQAERSRSEHLAAFGRASEQQLRCRKLAARASGILISQRNWSEFQAQSWIEAEARRQRRPVTVIAEQVIASSLNTNWLRATA